MAEKVYLTEEGLQKLKDEIQDLKSRGRQEMAKQIQEAREKGDLSENAEYDAAKEAQGLLEMKISQLETVLGNAVILDETKLDPSRVNVMSKVVIKSTKMNKDFHYQLVSENEADLKTGKISVKSPIGAGLLGKKVGDKVEIQVPNGTMEFEVVEVSM